MTYNFIRRFGNSYQQIKEPGIENEFHIVNDIAVVKPLNYQCSSNGESNEFILDGETWLQLPWSGWHVNKNGYVSCFGVPLHQVVAYLNDMIPAWGEVIDHKNRNRLDNRIQNLRPCSPIQNGWNSVKKHGHQLKNGKWRFTFSKSYPTMADAEEGLRSGEFQYMSKNRTCFINETFDTYEEGYQWWRFKAGIHYGEFSPFANPFKSCQEIVKEASENSKNQQPS